MARMKLREALSKNSDRSNAERNQRRDRRYIESKDKGKVRDGEIKEEPKGTKA